MKHAKQLPTSIQTKAAKQIAERLLRYAEDAFARCAYSGPSLDVWDLVEHLGPVAQRAAADEALRLVDEQVHTIVRGVMIQWLDRLNWKREDREEYEYFMREGHKSVRPITHAEAESYREREDAERQRQVAEALQRVWSGGGQRSGLGGKVRL